MQEAKTKALISCAVTAQLICVFVFTYAKSQFAYDATPLICRYHQVGKINLGCEKNEPPHEKTNNLHMRKQRRRSATKLISAFVFATQIVHFLFFLNPKFQASSSFL